MSKVLNCCCQMLYFALNIKYIVSTDIISNIKLTVLYFIVFNSIMSFAILHGIEVLSPDAKYYLCSFALNKSL